MKKFITGIFLLAALNSMAQTNRPDAELSLPDFPFTCPDGQCPVSFIYLDVANFHKPRTDCQSGFGLCIRFGGGIRCGHCSSTSYLNGAKVSAWAKIVGQFAELHIPAALRTTKGFEKTDFSLFEIEEGTLSFTLPNGKQFWAKGGKYPVSLEGTEMIVRLPF